MLTVFFDYQGIVHHEFQQQSSTITADSYLGVLRRLREAIRQKRPKLWRRKSWILHHDNAPAHTDLKISKFLQDHSTSVFPQPPYSPNLAPCDFFIFGKLNKKVKGSEISEHRRDQSGIEEGHEGDPENSLPEIFEEYYGGANDNFKGFFDTSKIPNYVQPNFYNVQFFTGHGDFNTYLFRIGKIGSPACSCGNEQQTPEHLLIDCPLTSDLREENQLYLTNTKQAACNKDQYIKFNRFCRMHILRRKR
ncbi:hypothetical protein LAZ67_12002141 [Cordylochernes scorpioides]|uniref:Transposase n=1 Tax=Cordylochernes scorpioides TaxID=51811 RepID=A0ABY6L1J8_9ARAC|nr:hypothetical protein LAZ67_12002141 [Cordylochernes scorpioides]